MGLILCAEKGTAEAHYALYNLPNKVHAAEYRMVLPDEKAIAEQTIRNATTNRSSWEEWKNYAVRDHLLTLNFEGLWKTVDARLHKLAEAESMVIEDPEILSGTPVVRGTRVPVHSVAALLAEEIPAKEILQAYPSLTELQVELASIYARAVPQRGRPKRKQLPAGAKVLSVTRGHLKTRTN